MRTFTSALVVAMAVSLAPAFRAEAVQIESASSNVTLDGPMVQLAGGWSQPIHINWSMSCSGGTGIAYGPTLDLIAASEATWSPPDFVIFDAIGQNNDQATGSVAQSIDPGTALIPRFYPSCSAQSPPGDAQNQVDGAMVLIPPAVDSVTAYDLRPATFYATFDNASVPQGVPVYISPIFQSKDYSGEWTVINIHGAGINDDRPASYPDGGNANQAYPDGGPFVDIATETGTVKITVTKYPYNSVSNEVDLTVVAASATTGSSGSSGSTGSTSGSSGDKGGCGSASADASLLSLLAVGLVCRRRKQLKN